jgi:hypothetical protein
LRRRGRRRCITGFPLSNQYYQETGGNLQGGKRGQDPTKRFTKAQWQKKFAVFDTVRERITPEDEADLDQAIDTAVQEVRADTSNAYGTLPA